MTLTAIPIWKGRVSPVLDCARRLVLVKVNNGTVVSKKEVLLQESFPLQRVERLVNLRADTLICGAISQSLASMITNSGIAVFAWICGSIDEVIEAFIDGRLSESNFTMPGCSGQRKESGRRRQTPQDI